VTFWSFMQVFTRYSQFEFSDAFLYDGGRDSSVGIATHYGLDGPGIKSWWGGEIFRTHPDQPWGPPSLLYSGYWVFPGGKAAVAWHCPPPHLVPRLRKE
jgi:hypothetical protein